MPHPAAVPLFAVFGPALAGAAAVVAVGVPLVIHLLFRKRYQVVPWAAVRFLLVAEKKHRRRIDQWLLLAARTLALLLPLAAMAAATPWAEEIWQRIRPGPPESVAHAARTHHVLLLDASLSMSARADDGGTRFETAVRVAEDMVRGGNAGDGFTLILLAGPPQAVVPGPANDPEKVVAELRRCRPTHGNTDPAAALAMAADVLTRSPRAYPRRQVTLLTDLQRSAWANTLARPDSPAAADLWQRLAARADVAVIDTARADLDNLAVVDVALADPLPIADAPAAVTVTVQNHGRGERRLTRLELLIGRPSAAGTDTTLVPVEQRVIDAVPAGGRAAVTFTLDGPFRLRDRGTHVLQARLVEHDDLPADDVRSLSVDVRDGLTALLVNGMPDPEPLRQSAEHLSRALAPPGARPSETPARPRVISVPEFADPALGDLSNADCVFLCDVPVPTPLMAARLEAHLKRGGGVVVGLGPNAAANRDAYNRVFFNDGNGILPGPLGEVVSSSPDAPGFRLAADEDAFRRPPLAAFRDANARAGLVTVPFREYVRLDPPADGRARRVLSFVPAGNTADPKGTDGSKPDLAVADWPRFRGRVVVYTSSFNRDWTDWPVLPSYLPFAHELLRFASAGPERHTVRVGEPLEEFFPPTAVGLTATLTGPGGLNATLPVTAQDETGVVRFPDTGISGLYRVGVGGVRDRVFAVNVPELAPGGGSESDLGRLDATDFKGTPSVQILSDPAAVKPSAADDGAAVVQPRPHGPTLARWLLFAAVAAFVAEVVCAWRFGPARSPGVGTGAARPAPTRWRPAGTLAALAPFAVAAVCLGTLAHAEWTGHPLGFLPESWRGWVEGAAGVPAAAPGEGTRWRVEGGLAFVPNPADNRNLLLGLAAAAAALMFALYRLERRAVGGWRRVVLPGLLRVAAFLVALCVLLPQLRLAFDREGWPDVAILLDTSASMDTVDDLQDPAVKAKAEELARVANLPKAHRLRLAQALLTRPGADWIDRLLAEKEVRVHVYAVAGQTQVVGTATDARDAAALREAMSKLTPDGAESRLGDGVQAVLKAFRGGALAAVVMFTDGVTTSGDDLPKAGREAARAGVPLFLVGTGDAKDRPDVILSDVQSEEAVIRGNELVFQARLTARGVDAPKPLPVTLFEKVGDRLVERARVEVRPGPPAAPAAVELRHTPTDAGEKTFVIDVPGQPGEADLTNDRAERTVIVAEARRLKVLLVEAAPRYEWRFVKVLLERETEKQLGGKAVELHTLLLDSSAGWAATDRSAEPLRGDFPTRDQLFQYDAVILGDVDPKQLPRASRTLQDLADFVRVRGGGLLHIPGENAGAVAFADTPLADVLPVVPSDAAGPRRTPEDQPITDAYRPKLTPTGQAHPLFRFAPREVDSAVIWNRLRPMYWFATGYKRKLSAEVLAVHPDRPAEGGPPGERHPLALQQFAGAGRVVFFGFDETWRWRWRADEEHFNRFWTQGMQVLARSRLGRVELRLDRQTPYRRGERIQVTVRFPDDAPAPADDAPVRVTVHRTPAPGTSSGDPETQTLKLAKVDGTRATYRGVLTRTPEGEYLFTLAEPDGAGPKPRAEAKVLPPRGEREQTDLNRADLAQAAALSRGKFYTLAEADQVFADLPDVPRVPLNQPVPPVPLWNQPAVYVLVLSLLAAEWLLRKRERLL